MASPGWVASGCPARMSALRRRLLTPTAARKAVVATARMRGGVTVAWCEPASGVLGYRLAASASSTRLWV
jgi:hypothetical protein